MTTTDSRSDIAFDEASLWPVAEALADIARVQTLTHFRKATKIESKTEDYDPVTEGDRSAEAAMRAHLQLHRPQDAILGEEYGQTPGTSGLTWILDPIDGTRGYVSGTPTWGVLIAVSDESGPRIGVIDQPYIGERFMGGPSRASMTGPLGQVDLQVKTTTELAEATILTTFPEIGTSQERAGFEAVASRCKLTRYGMDCYGYALLAAGQVDLVIEAGLQSYDIAAPIAVIEAAGGIVTDWSGGPAHNGGRALAAATPELHAAAMELIAEALG